MSNLARKIKWKSSANSPVIFAESRDSINLWKWISTLNKRAQVTRTTQRLGPGRRWDLCLLGSRARPNAPIGSSSVTLGLSWFKAPAKSSHRRARSSVFLIWYFPKPACSVFRTGVYRCFNAQGDGTRVGCSGLEAGVTGPLGEPVRGTFPSQPPRGPRVISNSSCRIVRCAKRKMWEQDGSKESILLSFRVGARG